MNKILLFFFLTLSIILSINRNAQALEFSSNNIANDRWASSGVVLSDVTGDGFLDIYIASRVISDGTNGQNRLWINNGSGSFSSNDILGDTGNTSNTSAADLNGDGFNDLYAPSSSAGQNKLWINDGTGNFSAQDISGDTGASSAGLLEDINADGFIDIHVSNTGQNKLWINDGTGNFSAQDISGDTGNSTFSAGSDLNGDGFVDIYVANRGQNKLWINDGTGNFSAQDISGDTGDSFSASLGDVNGDGFVDIYVANIFSQQNKLWINDGTGNFSAQDISGDLGYSYVANMADINGDGFLDIYTTNANAQNKLWINDGTGNFSAQDISGDRGNSRRSALGDLNGDGLVDIYTTNYNATNRFWLQIPELNINLSAPTTFSNNLITDTSISITDSLGVLVSEVQISPSSTVSSSAFNCVQTNARQVDCSISIASSGNLIISATNTSGTTKTSSQSYLIDIIPPSLPSVILDTSAGISNPTLSFSSSDNIALDYFELEYSDVNGNPATISPASSPESLVLDPSKLSVSPFVHEVTVRVYDTAGNFSENILKFPPIVIFTTPTTISNTNINNASVTITSPQDNDISNIIFSAGSTGSSLGSCIGDSGDSTAPYMSPVVCSINNIISSGSISLEGTDISTGATGNNLQEFIIETNPPSINIMAPTKSSNLAISDTSIQINDDIGINSSAILITAVNTSGSFSLSNIMCIQTNASQIDCSLTIDAQSGTGDIQVQASDLAGNITTVTETSYLIDTISPLTPLLAPDLQSSSDSGSSPTDDITNTISPVFDLVCTENNSSLELYVDGNLDSSINCSSIGTTSLSASTISNSGNYEISYLELDSLGNESPLSDSLDIQIDLSTANPSINTPSNGNPVSGIAELNAQIVMSTPSGSTCTTSADSGGNYSCVLSPNPVNGESITVVATDIAGNTANRTEISGIDTDLPISPTINPVQAGDIDISGTAEIGSLIVLDGLSCTNDPVTSDGLGNWTCIGVSPTPQAGNLIQAHSTDSAANSSTGSYQIPQSQSSSSSSTIRYICKDSQAVNYNDSNFGRNNIKLCRYDLETREQNPNASQELVSLKLEICPNDILITQNMKYGDRDGQYSSYYKGVITELKLLQSHINRLLETDYGKNAAGPVDGIFLSLTEQGVMYAQNKLNKLFPKMTALEIDGVVGPLTREAINQSC